MKHYTLTASHFNIVLEWSYILAFNRILAWTIDLVNSRLWVCDVRESTTINRSGDRRREEKYLKKAIVWCEQCHWLHLRCTCFEHRVLLNHSCSISKANESFTPPLRGESSWLGSHQRWSTPPNAVQTSHERSVRQRKNRRPKFLEDRGGPFGGWRTRQKRKRGISFEFGDCGWTLWIERKRVTSTRSEVRWKQYWFYEAFVLLVANCYQREREKKWDLYGNCVGTGCHKNEKSERLSWWHSIHSHPLAFLVTLQANITSSPCDSIGWARGVVWWQSSSTSTHWTLNSSTMIRKFRFMQFRKRLQTGMVADGSLFLSKRVNIGPLDIPLRLPLDLIMLW